MQNQQRRESAAPGRLQQARWKRLQMLPERHLADVSGAGKGRLVTT